jgi:two-component system phosphate regulon response regulator PhoB
MSKGQILVVDDEEDILELVKYNLTTEGYEVKTAGTGEEALRMVKSGRADLMVLDLMLPGINGLDVAKQIKSNPWIAGIPIIMLTAKGEESDVVTGLELGADDYITKPFSPKILNARVNAVIRRHKETVHGDAEILHVHDLTIHPVRREVLAGGAPVDLTYTEFQVLHYLARRPGWVATRSQIVDAVRGDDYPVTDRSVDVQIVGLRKKLGAFGKYIETVRGVGYRFKEAS